MSKSWEVFKTVHNITANRAISTRLKYVKHHPFDDGPMFYYEIREVGDKFVLIETDEIERHSVDHPDATSDRFVFKYSVVGLFDTVADAEQAGDEMAADNTDYNEIADKISTAWPDFRAAFETWSTSPNGINHRDPCLLIHPETDICVSVADEDDRPVFEQTIADALRIQIGLVEAGGAPLKVSTGAEFEETVRRVHTVDAVNHYIRKLGSEFVAHGTMRRAFSRPALSAIEIEYARGVRFLCVVYDDADGKYRLGNGSAVCGNFVFSPFARRFDTPGFKEFSTSEAAIEALRKLDEIRNDRFLCDFGQDINDAVSFQSASYASAPAGPELA